MTSLKETGLYPRPSRIRVSRHKTYPVHADRRIVGVALMSHVRCAARSARETQTRETGAAAIVVTCMGETLRDESERGS